MLIMTETMRMTINADPGAFGFALGTLGFDRVAERPDDGWAGHHIISGRAADDGRVVTWPDDGHRVELIGWNPEHPGTRLVAWKAALRRLPPQTSSSRPSRSPPASSR